VSAYIELPLNGPAGAKGAKGDTGSQGLQGIRDGSDDYLKLGLADRLDF
jgi:hypothetical protein